MKALQRTLRGAVLVFLLTAHPSVGLAASFAIQNIQPTEDGGFTLTWPTVPGRTYQVVCADSPSGPWSESPDGLLVAGTNQFTLSYTDYPSTNAPQRLYRIKITYKLVLSLVLDRSGSMQANGGAYALAPAVSHFIDLFDDEMDRASMTSFSSGSTVDVSMRWLFKNSIKAAANTMIFGGWTVAERGLTNALAQNESVIPAPGENLMKVIVFFTDGMANTWYYDFNCGPRNVSPSRTLHDPTTGANASAGCTVPTTLPAINPQSGALTPNAVNTTSCADMHLEAERRAERIAYLARGQGNYIYAIGMGNPTYPGECSGVFPTLNPNFLKNLANTPDSATYNPNQPSGDYVIAANATELDQAFQSIVEKIFLRSP